MPSSLRRSRTSARRGAERPHTRDTAGAVSRERTRNADFSSRTCATRAVRTLPRLSLTKSKSRLASPYPVSCRVDPDSDPDFDSDFDALGVGFRCADSIPGVYRSLLNRHLQCTVLVL
jgi:hypothetical protein